MFALKSLTWYKDEYWHIKNCLLVGFILGIIFLFVILNYDVETYYTTVGVVKNQNIILVLPIDKLQTLLNKKKVIIEKQIYQYQVIEILDDLQIEKDQFYKQVIIKVALPKRMLKDNNTFSILIPLDKKSIFRILKSYWKEE